MLANQYFSDFSDSSDSGGFAIDLLQLMPETPPFLCPVGV